jgi:hypothetical protein
MTQPIYLSPAAYREALDAIMSKSMDSDNHENAVRLALGEHCNVWPDTIEQGSTGVIEND